MARIVNVGIASRDMTATVAFYRDVLDLSVHIEGEGWCFLDGGGVFVVITPASESGPGAPTGHGIWLDIAVDNLEAAKARLAEATVSVEREWEDHNGKFVLITDPDGNYLELFEPR